MPTKKGLGDWKPPENKVEINFKQKTGFIQSFLNSTGTTAGMLFGVFVGIVIILMVLAFIGVGLHSVFSPQQSIEYRENYLAKAGSTQPSQTYENTYTNSMPFVESTTQPQQQIQPTEPIGQEGYPCKVSGDCASGFCCGGYVSQYGPNAGYATCRQIGKTTCFP